ncbi:zinc-binding dehydrogenase [Nonomuraea jiangxiensis]|uniref:NADPH:quinone reductase n=1 Tax=Nonomuraea jiangxiensis TaxID=633440 RepID=A0A1G8F0D6_9ACTN|nr:zinc-binding dehydrogenase [Nonomuraea jiangxiensis]SDH75601.1 NADPH:quinone reductase [Nonomuraea jiangxiensis]
MSVVLVTGATGTVGRQVAAQLTAAGVGIKPLSRATGDLRDPGSLPLDGVEAVFLVWPFASAEGAAPVVGEIARRVRRVVYLSSAAVREPEREIERLIEESGPEWTFLRPHAFAANTLRWARQVRAGVVRGAYGQAAMPLVHERDIAAVAVRALLDDGHHGAVHALTGPESLTQADQLRIISEVLKFPARWVEVPPDEARADLLATGLPAAVADDVLRAQAALVSHPAPVTRTVEEVTKAAPRTFRQWVADHAADFREVPAPATTMRAARLHEYGGPIHHDRIPTPRPGPGEVLIEVAGNSFNPSELGLRAGLLRNLFELDLPHTFGWDVSGTVVETGPGVTDPAPGERVFGLVTGSAADYVVAPASLLAPAPRSIPLADAAAVPVAGLTAWQAVHEQAPLAPGQRVLINGAGGGIGLFAVQLARLAGATVTATASPRSAAAVARYGAHEVIDYTTTPLPGGMDVVLNLAGIPAEQATVLAGLGRTVLTAATPIEGGTHFVMRNDPAQLAELAALIDKGELAVEVVETHPLTELAEIHRRAEAGDTRGKIILLPA